VVPKATLDNVVASQPLTLGATGGLPAGQAFPLSKAARIYRYHPSVVLVYRRKEIFSTKHWV